MNQNPSFQISDNVWVIQGENKNKFPSGASIFISTENHKILIDTNPGNLLIEEFLKDSLNLEIADITDIILTHPHLDHSKSLGALFEKAKPLLWGLEDSLKRAENSKYIGLYAGVPLEGIRHFENFGDSLGFINRRYPANNKKIIKPMDILEFDSISISCNETHAHALHVLDLDIVDGNSRLVYSQDYDFTPVPWYGVPQRGQSVQEFIQETTKIVKKGANFIISAHRPRPIEMEDQEVELKQYVGLINKRTDKVINILKDLKRASLTEFPNFVYPIEKMKGRYSDDYIYLGQIWDYWILLAHLEEALRLGKVKCIDSGGDIFLKKCIESNRYRFDIVDELLIKDWAKSTLNKSPSFKIPLQSKWEII